MKELICIVCPKGCHLHVDDENGYTVKGHSCPRGEVYGHNEIKNPTRVLTSTVRIDGALYRRCPVKTASAVPKGKLMDIMRDLNDVTLTSPVRIGQVILPDVEGTGVDVVATKNL